MELKRSNYEKVQNNLSLLPRHLGSWNWAKSLVLLSCLTLFSPAIDAPAYSQTLDEAIASMLGNNCAGFDGTGTGGLGPNLSPFCPTPSPLPGGTATGGGTGAVQSTGLSVSNSTIRKRLEEARSGEEDKKGLNGQSTAQGMYTSMESERFGNRLAFFAAGNAESLERDITTFQNGYDSTILGLTGGADYRFNDKILGGLAINFQNQNGDFKNNGGSFSKNDYGVTAFVSVVPLENTFIQILGGYTRSDYDVIRAATFSNTRGTLSGDVASDSDIDIFNFGILAGRDYRISKVDIGPRIGLNYSNTHISDYTESGSTGLELVYDDQWINSFQSVLGFVVSMPISTGVGVFVPQMGADYIHEFANSQRAIIVHFVEDTRSSPTKFKFLNDGPDRDFVNLSFGVSAVLPHGIQPFANFRVMVGNDQFDNYAGTFGLRVELGST